MSKCILVNIAESGSMHGSQGKSAHKGVEALVLGTLGMPVRGLSNLGNTCFFNAVMQNLLQTPLLSMCLSTDSLHTPCVLSTPDLPLLNVDRTRELGPLTSAMQCFFANISSGSRGTASPKQLFVEVCKKATRFRGFQQQDSQELLRYLLDAMKTEEIKVGLVPE
jgi:ubiquitin carboxyl-terminal hydrolase 16/45